MTDDPNVEKKIVPNLLPALNDYGSTYDPDGLPVTESGSDLVDELAARNIEVDAAGEEWLRNADVWPPDVVAALKSLVHAFEVNRIRFTFSYLDDGTKTETSLPTVTVELAGPH